MCKYLILGYLLLLVVSCNSRQDSEPETQPIHPSIVNIATDVSTSEPNNEPVESFSDDSNIGRPRKNKIEIEIVSRGSVDSASRPNNTAIIKFYLIRASKEWTLKQTLEIESHALAGADPKIEDFNNDGLKDITFRSNTAARGSNDVRTLLIYDKTNDVLVHVKNSEDYPNLAYNKALKCIDSWMVHGASTTVFLRLEGDLLKEFASVGTGANRDGNCCALTVRITEKAGKETVIRRKRITEDDIYTRFRTFDPPQP